VLLGGAPNHQLAVDVHFTPLLLELGAAVPVRGLFVLESDVEGFASFAAKWAAANGSRLVIPESATGLPVDQALAGTSPAGPARPVQV
jgi:hypothetical protein